MVSTLKRPFERDNDIVRRFSRNAKRFFAFFAPSQGGEGSDPPHATRTATSAALQTVRPPQEEETETRLDARG